MASDQELLYKRCIRCDKKPEDDIDVVLFRCSRCKRVAYCSVECQNKDWNTHRQFCDTIIDLVGPKQAKKDMKALVKHELRKSYKERIKQLNNQ
jgi:hypothetical protein